MRKMKKKITAFVFMLITNGLFAQNTEYNNHLSKGKEYESQKKWIYALSEYYDAIISDSSVDDNALKLWDDLSEAIKKGNPGKGDFDDFDFFDNWIMLLQEYEKYWTENVPYLILFDKPEKTELHRDAKTADYKIHIRLQKSEKYSLITDILRIGFSKAYSSEWNMEYLKNWPEISVYNDSKNTSFFQNGAALVSEVDIYHSSGMHIGRGGGFFGAEDINTKLLQTQSENIRLASTAFVLGCEERVSSFYKEGESFYMGEAFSLLSIKFHITDNNNNKLLTSLKYNIVTDPSFRASYYEFKNVDKEKMQFLDSGEINFCIDEISLKYGKMTSLAGWKDWSSSLNEIKIDCNKVNYVWSSVNGILKTSSGYGINSFEKINEERNNVKEEKKAIETLISRLRSVYNNLNSTNCIFIDGNKKEKPTEIIDFDWKRVEDSVRELENANMTLKYTKKQIYDVLCYFICNDLSKAQGLETYYSLEGVNDSDADSVIKYLDNYASIKFNLDVNGWHMPTSDEIQKIDEKWNSERKKKRIISSQDLSYRKESDILSGMFIIHNVK